MSANWTFYYIADLFALVSILILVKVVLILGTSRLTEIFEVTIGVPQKDVIVLAKFHMEMANNLHD